MTEPAENSTLSTETANVLLQAIKDAAPDSDDRSTEGLESLARAYSLVCEAMPNPPPAPRSGRVY